MPGPNLEPSKAILKGWPIPLKLVLCFSIKPFIIFSKLSLLALARFSNSFKKSFKTFLDKSQEILKNFKTNQSSKIAASVLTNSL